MEIETVFVSHYFAMIIMAIVVGLKFKVDWKKVLNLIFLPLLIWVIIGLTFIFSMEYKWFTVEQFFILMGGTFIMPIYTMFSALILFAVSIEAIEKTLKPKAIILFLWALLPSCVIVMIHGIFMFSDIGSNFIVVFVSGVILSMLIGTLSVIIQYYFLQKP